MTPTAYFLEFLKFLAGFAVILGLALLLLHFFLAGSF
jgi:hypothetical protein